MIAFSQRTTEHPLARMERNTRQRAAISGVLERLARPLSPHEVLAEARKEVRGLGIATVYRALKALVDEGSVHVVELPGEPARYERAAGEHHHHFRCRRCDRVFEVAGCPKGLAAVVPKGFKLEAHDLVLYGTCRSCRAA